MTAKHGTTRSRVLARGVAVFVLLLGAVLVWGATGAPAQEERTTDDYQYQEQYQYEEQYQEEFPPPSSESPPSDTATDTGTDDGTFDDVEDPVRGSADLTASPFTGPAPLTVTFDGSGSTGVDSYRLEFGDGESVEGRGAAPSGIAHTYANPSTYTATLTIISNEDLYSDAVDIVVEEPRPDKDEEAKKTTAPAAEEGDVLPPKRERQDPAGPDEEEAVEELDGLPTAAHEAFEAGDRSLFVSSVRAPTELSFDPRLIAEAVLITALLIMLIGFPAEMFNSTLLEHYEEITGWFGWRWVERFRTWSATLPGFVVAIAFAFFGALIHANLEPGFGLDKASLALFVGIFVTFLVISFLYDVMRGFQLRRRHGLDNRLRAQALGMVVAALCVLASRIGDFHPGYMYGLFTALVYGADLHERHHGRALARASVRLAVVAAVAWFAWIPVKHMAEQPGASFLILALDASLAVLWVGGLAAIVFGLAPLRFFYGETVKKWNVWVWLAIYVPGVFMFVYTLVHPERGLYGSSEEASLPSVLLLFIGFAVFSVAFWGFFKVRDARRAGRASRGADLPA